MSILSSTSTGAATVRPNSTFLSNYCAKSNRKIRVSYLNGKIFVLRWSNNKIRFR